MKALGLFFIAFIVFFSLLCLNNNESSIDINKIQAIYLGINVDGNFEFEDIEGNIIAFQELYSFSIHDLYEEIYIGRNFEILWDSIDEEIPFNGSPIKKIARLKMLN